MLLEAGAITYALVMPQLSINLRRLLDSMFTHTFITSHSMFSDPIVRMLLEAGANTYGLEMPQLRLRAVGRVTTRIDTLLVVRGLL
jgi:hypothetical protein